MPALTAAACAAGARRELDALRDDLRRALGVRGIAAARDGGEGRGVENVTRLGCDDAGALDGAGGRDGELDLGVAAQAARARGFGILGHARDQRLKAVVAVRRGLVLRGGGGVARAGAAAAGPAPVSRHTWQLCTRMRGLVVRASQFSRSSPSTTTETNGWPSTK